MSVASSIDAGAENVNMNIGGAEMNLNSRTHEKPGKLDSRQGAKARREREGEGNIQGRGENKKLGQ